MNQLTIDQTIRVSKATLMLFISFFGILMLFSNLTDYSANYESLSHILSMDTTSDLSRYSYRAITSPLAHHRVYWLIITLEVLFTVFCMVGTYHLFKNIKSTAKKFHEAKKFALIGLMIAILVYYVGFQVIGTEWFNMDQSIYWNHKDWARHIIDFILPLLIYVTLRIER